MRYTAGSLRRRCHLQSERCPRRRLGHVENRPATISCALVSVVSFRSEDFMRLLLFFGPPLCGFVLPQWFESSVFFLPRVPIIYSVLLVMYWCTRVYEGTSFGGSRVLWKRPPPGRASGTPQIRWGEEDDQEGQVKWRMYHATRTILIICLKPVPCLPRSTRTCGDRVQCPSARLTRCHL